jgi:hypothetical protein
MPIGPPQRPCEKAPQCLQGSINAACGLLSGVIEMASIALDGKDIDLSQFAAYHVRTRALDLV